MSPEKLDAVTTELKRFAQELNLSDSQKAQLRTSLEEKHAKLQEFRQQNPNISNKDLVQKIVSIRGSLREQVVKFLTPQQLAKWDAEEARAKELLGQNIAA
jgi:predicted HTH transcriptional regulator